MLKKIVRRYVVATGFGVLTSISAFAEGDPIAGKFDFDTCAGCHSVPGYTNVYPTYHVPRLGGQNPDYVINALKAYKAGERNHPTMKANADSLTDEQMLNIATYVSGFKSDPAERPALGGRPEVGKKLSQTCAACHGEDGNGNPQMASAGYPRLAGQYADYLRQALSEYRSGARSNPIMASQVVWLTDQNIADLAAYYSSLPNGLVTAGHE